MAPMATGIIIREMESPNVRKYPKGVKDMTIRIAVIRPMLVSSPTDILLLATGLLQLFRSYVFAPFILILIRYKMIWKIVTVPRFSTDAVYLPSYGA